MHIFMCPDHGQWPHPPRKIQRNTPCRRGRNNRPERPRSHLYSPRICEHRYLQGSLQCCISSPIFLMGVRGATSGPKATYLQRHPSSGDQEAEVLFLGTSLSSRHLLLLGDPYDITILKAEFKCLNEKKTVCPCYKTPYKLCWN